MKNRPVFKHWPTGLALALLSLVAYPGSAAGQACPDPKSTDFKREALIPPGQLREPIELSVAKDGRVFIVERAGTLQMYDPAKKAISQAVKLDVYINPGAYDVGGILSVAVTADFPATDWVYLYYAPKAQFSGQNNHTTGRLTYYLSRFRFVADHLDVPSEQVLLKIPAIWETHNGGSMKFGRNGDLYLSVGDNSDCCVSDQYSAMDERPGYEFADDQRSTANTNDLRGKILRIHPEETKQADGNWYSIPKGNLMEKYASVWPTPELAAKVRPEIFAMGFRNPYRIFPDPVTGRLYIGEFGPAAPNASDRGPAGADQIKIIDSAAYLGYPYFLKDNQPYCHWDYGQGKCIPIQGQSGLKFDPLRPVNYSRNNTGVNILPAVHAASLWEHDGSSPDPIPGLKTCGFEAGPVYHFDPSLKSAIKFPPFFDGKWTFTGFGNGGWTAKIATLSQDVWPRVTQAANPPWVGAPGGSFTSGIHDMEYGPGDGALYVVDYGSGAYSNNPDAGLFRVSYSGCLPPVSLKPGPAAGREEWAPGLLGGQRLRAPAGARSLEIFDSAGRKVWETRWGAIAPEYLQVPEDLKGGLLRLRWN
jgi:cytochrome c